MLKASLRELYHRVEEKQVCKDSIYVVKFMAGDGDIGRTVVVKAKTPSKTLKRPIQRMHESKETFPVFPEVRVVCPDPAWVVV